MTSDTNSLYGPTTVPRLDETAFDLRVLFFALAVSAATALIFGMAPAVQASLPPAATLQNGGRGSGAAGRQRVRSILTVVEAALSVGLLVGAGLLVRSLWYLQQVDPGFNASPLMAARVVFTSPTYDNQTRGVFYERLLTEIQALPGIVAAAASSGLPMAGGNTNTEFQVPRAEAPTNEQASAGWRLVTPGYFAAMGVPLRGRDFSWRDHANEIPTIIISDAMAREFWPNEDPIGQSITLDTFGGGARTIIGAAGDVRHLALDTEPQWIVYYSAGERGAFGGMRIVWRSAADPASHVAAVRDRVRRIDPTVLLFGIQSFDDLLADSFAPRRFNLYLFGVFAGLALLLAGLGLFGVMAYLVSQRTREIGVRLALGAHPRDIFRLILGRGHRSGHRRRGDRHRRGARTRAGDAEPGLLRLDNGSGHVRQRRRAARRRGGSGVLHSGAPCGQN